MADLKISQLTNGNPALAGDLIPIDRSGNNFAVTATSVAALAGGGGGATVPYFWSSGDTVPWVPNYSPGSGLNANLAPTTAEVYKVVLPWNCAINKASFGYYSVAGDSGFNLIFGLYNSSGNKILDTGSLAIPAGGGSDVTGSVIHTFGSAINITPGYYYFVQGWVSGAPSSGSGAFGWASPNFTSDLSPNTFRTPFRLLMDIDNAGSAPALQTGTTSLAGGTLPSTLTGLTLTPSVSAPSGSLLAMLFHN